MVKVHFEMDDEPYRLFARKHKGTIYKDIIDLILEDIGWETGKMVKRESELLNQLELIKKELEEIGVMKERFNDNRKKLLESNKDKIKKLFTLKRGGLNIPISWKGDQEEAPKIGLIGLEGYSKDDVWRLFNDG